MIKIRSYAFVTAVFIGGVALGLGIYRFEGEKEVTYGQKRVVRLAYLTKDAPAHNRVRKGFLNALKQDTSSQYEVTVYYTQGEDRLKAIAGVEEAVLSGVDIFVANGALMSQVAKSVTDKRKKNTPVVFIGATNPVHLGLVDSEEFPGGNVTGVNMISGRDIVLGRVLFFLKPSIKHLLIPYCPLASGGLLEGLAEANASFFREKGVEVTLLPIETVADVVPKIKSFISLVDTIMNFEGCLTSAAAEGVIKLCNQHGKTFFSGELAVVRQGAACGFGADFAVSGARAVEYVKAIVSGQKKPSELPVLYISDARKVGLNTATMGKQSLELADELSMCITQSTVFDTCKVL